jgi:hypothetical protein
MKPTLLARQSARPPSPSVAMSTPPISMVPLVGWSMPAMRLSRVLLPEPEGPISATNSPAITSSWMSSSTGMGWPPRS